MKIALAAFASTMAHSSEYVSLVNATKSANRLRKNGKHLALPGLIAAFDFGAQPGPCVIPKPVCACSRQAKGCAGLLDRHTREEMQLDELSGRRVLGGQSAERPVQRYQIVWLWIQGDAGIEVYALPVAAVLRAFLAASIFDENASHGLRRSGEEMAAAVPMLHFLHVHEP